MRFSSLGALVLAAMSALAPAGITAGATKQLLTRAETAAVVDVCAEVSASLVVPNILLPGKTITIGKIEACICVSDVSLFVSTNIIAIAATAIVGKVQVVAIITDMIEASPGHATCTYPTHASPQCLQGNPCGFTCQDGFTPSPASHPTICVCAAPNKECNGKCGHFPACASGHSKRDAVVPFWTRNKNACSNGLTACAVIGARSSAWDCVDTQSDLWSCGGCTMGGLHPDGVDCTALPGVSDVSCVRGGCVVHRCMPGYQIAEDAANCEYDEDRDPVFLAAQYGVEHVPL